MRRFRPVVALGALWALVLAGCGDAAEEVATPAAPETTATTAPAQPAAGTPAPAAVPAALRFTAKGLDGSRISGADFAGRDVAMWFWAPW